MRIFIAIKILENVFQLKMQQRHHCMIWYYIFSTTVEKEISERKQLFDLI